MNLSELREQMRATIEDWHQSGMAQADYGRSKNISLHKLRYWTGKIKKKLKEKKTSIKSSGFIRLTPQAHFHDEPFRIRYSNGVKLMCLLPPRFCAEKPDHTYPSVPGRIRNNHQHGRTWTGNGQYFH